MKMRNFICSYVSNAILFVFSSFRPYVIPSIPFHPYLFYVHTFHKFFCVHTFHTQIPDVLYVHMQFHVSIRFYIHIHCNSICSSLRPFVRKATAAQKFLIDKTFYQMKIFPRFVDHKHSKTCQEVLNRDGEGDGGKQIP